MEVDETYLAITDRQGLQSALGRKNNTAKVLVALAVEVLEPRGFGASAASACAASPRTRRNTWCRSCKRRSSRGQGCEPMARLWPIAGYEEVRLRQHPRDQASRRRQARHRTTIAFAHEPGQTPVPGRQSIERCLNLLECHYRRRLKSTAVVVMTRTHLNRPSAQRLRRAPAAGRRGPCHRPRAPETLSGKQWPG